MSYCTIMDYAAAKLLLNELIGHLLIEWWWLFHQKEEDELGIAKTLDHHLDTVEALLVNVAIVKETAQRLNNVGCCGIYVTIVVVTSTLQLSHDSYSTMLFLIIYP